LEFVHDHFIAAVNEKEPGFAAEKSKAFPRHFKEKTDFLVGVLLDWPELRMIPIFSDGTLNLQWLQYQLDELYDVRSALAHGSISVVEKGDGWTRWRLERWVKGEKPGTWTVASATVGSGFLAHVVATSRGIRHYLIKLEMAVEGNFTWEKAYKSDCEIRASRETVRELVELGVIASPKWLNSLIGLGDDRR